MKQVPRQALKFALILNFPITLLLLLLFISQLNSQSKIEQDINSIKKSIVDIEIISSKQASSSADTLSQTVEGLRTDISHLKALQRTENISEQLTGKIAGISTSSSKMYPRGIQGYVALDTSTYHTADILQDRTNDSSILTTITDDTQLPFSFKANGWYLVTLNQQQGWIKSIYVKDVTAQVYADYE